MTWTSGLDLVNSTLVGQSDLNPYLGAGSNFDHLSDGTKIVNVLVRESSMNIGNAPSNKKLMTADSTQTGGLQWDGDVDEAITLSFLNM